MSHQAMVEFMHRKKRTKEPCAHSLQGYVEWQEQDTAQTLILLGCQSGSNTVSGDQSETAPFHIAS